LLLGLGAENGFERRSRAAQIYGLSPADAKTNHQSVIALGVQHFF
jgi:hypothetical protein